MALAAAALLGACTPRPEVTTGPETVEYLGIETLLLDEDMVNFRLAMKGMRGAADIETYGRCAAAQYALIRGAGFARHVRTTFTRKADVWYGDAVYLISSALPRGLSVIDAEVTVQDCGRRGIPTI